MKHNGRNLITAKEAASRIGISLPTFYKLAKSGLYKTEPTRKIRGRRLWFYADQF